MFEWGLSNLVKSVVQNEAHMDFPHMNCEAIYYSYSLVIRYANEMKWQGKKNTHKENRGQEKCKRHKDDLIHHDRRITESQVQEVE